MDYINSKVKMGWLEFPTVLCWQAEGGRKW